MQFSISHSPGFSILEVCFQADEVLYGQPDSMLSMSAGIEIGAKVAGHTKTSGFWAGLKNMMSGESFFSAIYRAKRDGAQVTLAPASIGDIVAVELREQSYFLTAGAYLANGTGLELQSVYGGMKGWMSKKGIFLMHASGTGTVFLATHGAVVRQVLAEGEQLILDNSFVVAFEASVDYELVKATADVKSSLMSGEGLVNRYTGPGEVIYQTRGLQKTSSMGAALVDLFT